jgi:hypothetical protein
MKHIRKFNESQNEEITLTMDDVRKLKHNLEDSFMDKYKDDTLIVTENLRAIDLWNNKSKDCLVLVYDLLHKSTGYKDQLGYAIKIGNKVEYLISIYEPRGCSINDKRGVVTAHGHEQIIKLWLDDGEFEETYTR